LLRGEPLPLRFQLPLLRGEARLALLLILRLLQLSSQQARHVLMA
jgi:hypothetical protein